MDEFTLSNILIDHLVLFEAMEAKIIGQFQGYMNRYNIIDCEDKKRIFMCFEKRSLIKQQGKFVERFSELMKNLSDMPKFFVYIAKITVTTWCINNIIPVSIALVSLNLNLRHYTGSSRVSGH